MKSLRVIERRQHTTSFQQIAIGAKRRAMYRDLWKAFQDSANEYDVGSWTVIAGWFIDG